MAHVVRDATGADIIGSLLFWGKIALTKHPQRLLGTGGLDSRDAGTVFSVDQMDLSLDRVSIRRCCARIGPRLARKSKRKD